MSDGRSHDHHTLQVMRQQAIKAVHEGQTVGSVAAALGVNERSVFRWLAAFAKGGPDALLAKSIPGRPSRLSHTQMVWIARVVRENAPEQLGFKSGLWTLSLIRHLIKHQFGIELSTATVHRMMKTLGFRAQTPLWQDLMSAQTWETRIRPAIIAEARRTGATVYITNESEVCSNYHADMAGTPETRLSTVATTDQPFSLHMLSATNPRGEIHFMLHHEKMTATVLLEFLKRLLVGATPPVFLVVDGRQTRHYRMIKTYTDSLGGRLRLFFLSPHSP